MEKKFSELYNFLQKQWNDEKNIKINFEDIIIGLNDDLWWKCSKGHEWKDSIVNRALGSECPFCSKDESNKNNPLKEELSNLINDWHPTKNGSLKPKDVSKGSHKKIWWKCSKGHEWLATMNSRTNGKGCPYCSGRMASEKHNLKNDFPDIARDWHPTKNNDLKVTEITPASSKKIWWKCSKGHEWEAPVFRRTKQNTGCPYCSGKKILEENSLIKTNPELIKEWNFEKNIILSPEKVSKGSNKKVWWKCSKGHEWQTTISNRTYKNSNCPFCKIKKDCDLNE